jgi:hypothetical protein
MIQSPIQLVSCLLHSVENKYICKITTTKKALLIINTQKIRSVKHTMFIKDHGAYGNVVATCNRQSSIEEL